MRPTLSHFTKFFFAALVLLPLLATAAAPTEPKTVIVKPVDPNATPRDSVNTVANRKNLQTAAAAAPVDINMPTTFEELKDRISACTTLPNTVMRMQCYDRIATNLGFFSDDKQKHNAQVMGTYGFWQASSKVNAIGESMTYLRLTAQDPLTMSSGVKKYPDLVLRCKPKTTDVYIDWKGPLAPPSFREKTMYMSYRLDSAEATAQDWEVSLDKNALFSPHPIDLVRELKGKSTMVVQFSPYNEGSMNMTFTLTGLDNAIGIIIDRCYR